MYADSSLDFSPRPTPHQQTGNRCGHDPQSPRWFTPPQNHKGRPPILRELIERLRQFYRAPDRIPSLATVHHRRHQALAGRRMRSERREACCCLLGAIVHYCDLPSMTLGVPQQDAVLLPVRLDTLAKQAGLGQRRAERAMRDIVDAGLVTVHRRCEQLDDGSYRGRAAIRVLPSALFGLFGLDRRLKAERQRISQLRRKRRDARKPRGVSWARTVLFERSSQVLTGKAAGVTEPPLPQTTSVAAVAAQTAALEPSAARENNLRQMKAILKRDDAGPAPRQSQRDELSAAVVADEPTTVCKGRDKDPP